MITTILSGPGMKLFRLAARKARQFGIADLVLFVRANGRRGMLS